MISLLSDGDNSYIIIFAIILSISGSFFDAIMPLEKYQNTLFTFLYIFDLFSQLIILVLVYLTMSYIGFYVIIALKIILSCCLFYIDDRNVHFSIVPSIYKIHSLRTIGILNAAAAAGVFNFILMILITVFVYHPIINIAANTNILDALLVISWLFGVFLYIIFVTLSGLYHDDKIDIKSFSDATMEKLQHFSDSVQDFICHEDMIEDQMTCHYYQHLDSVQYMAEYLQTVSVASYIIVDRPDYLCVADFKIILTGSAGCGAFKTLTIDRFSVGIKKKNEDSPAEVSSVPQAVKDYQEKRTFIVYAYIHFEEINLDLYCNVADEVIVVIADYFGLDGDKCFCCAPNHGNKMVDYEYTFCCPEEKTFKIAHIHDIHADSPKFREKIQFEKTNLIYCVSLLDYAKVVKKIDDDDDEDDNERSVSIPASTSTSISISDPELISEEKVNETDVDRNLLMDSIEKFGELVKSAAFWVVVIYFVDYKEFSEKININKGHSFDYLMKKFKKKTDGLDCIFGEMCDKPNKQVTLKRLVLRIDSLLAKKAQIQGPWW